MKTNVDYGVISFGHVVMVLVMLFSFIMTPNLLAADALQSAAVSDCKTQESGVLVPYRSVEGLFYCSLHDQAGDPLLRIAMQLPEDARIICCVPGQALETTHSQGTATFNWKVKDLDKSTFNIIAMSAGKTESIGQWRGSNSKIRNFEFYPSDHPGIDVIEVTDYQGERRKLFHYDSAPGQPKKGTFIFADGNTVGMFAAAFEQARTVYSLPAVHIFALESKSGLDESGRTLRASEYVLGINADNAVYEQHDAFFMEIFRRNVVPVAELDCSDCRYFLGGFSNGGDWAYTTANRYEDVFSGIIALSMLSANAFLTYPPEDYSGLLMMAAGYFESGATTLVKRASVVRAEHDRDTLTCFGYTGHDASLWGSSLVAAYVWLLGKPADLQRELTASCEGLVP